MILSPWAQSAAGENETPKRVPCSQKKQEVYRWLLTARQMARRKQSETSDRIWTHEKSTQQARLASKVRHKRTNRWHRHHSHQHPPWWPRSHGSDTAARIYLGNTPSTPASVADSGSASAAEDKQGPGGGDEIAERPQFWECEGVAAANRRCTTSPYSLRVDWGRCLVCAAGPQVCRGRGASPCLAVGVGRRVTAKSGSVLSNAWAAGLARTTGVRRRRRMASVPFELRSTNPNGSREQSRVAQVRASLEQRLEDRISRIEPIRDQQRHRGGRGVPQWARYCGPSLCLSGRGAYSTGSLKMAARYAITHYFHDPLAPMHPWVVKMVLLIGIPSDGGDLPVAAWEQQDRSGLSKSEKKRTPPSSSPRTTTGSASARCVQNKEDVLVRRTGPLRLWTTVNPQALGGTLWGFVLGPWNQRWRKNTPRKEKCPWSLRSGTLRRNCLGRGHYVESETGEIHSGCFGLSMWWDGFGRHAPWGVRLGALGGQWEAILLQVELNLQGVMCKVVAWWASAFASVWQLLLATRSGGYGGYVLGWVWPRTFLGRTPWGGVGGETECCFLQTVRKHSLCFTELPNCRDRPEVAMCGTKRGAVWPGSDALSPMQKQSCTA